MTDGEVESGLELYIRAVLGKKAKGIVVLDVHALTSVADVFIICSGRSSRQVAAIADFIRRDLKKNGIRPLSAEGLSEGHWALLDYGHIVIHVFYEPIREFYDLEGLWADARRIDIDALMPVREAEEDREPGDEEDS
jgi:ribosome-associated protein